MNGVRFPNESAQYRAARDELLAAERSLRQQMESVARMRRELPPGGHVEKPYAFKQWIDGSEQTVTMSDLFGRFNDLLIYNFMYRPEMAEPCPMCCAMLDALDSQMPHLSQGMSVAVVARHDVSALTRVASERGWRHLRLLSSAGNDFNIDYHGESDGSQLPMASVFERGTDGTISHFWSSELFFAETEPDQHPRHVDLLWPLWQVLDLTRSGRDANWLPSLKY